MQPAESIFAHLLDLAHGLANTVMTQMAIVVDSGGKELSLPEGTISSSHALAANGSAAKAMIVPGAHGELTWHEIRTLMQGVPPARLRNALTQLRESDILTECAPDVWRFNSTLFRRWVARNPWDGFNSDEE